MVKNGLIWGLALGLLILGGCGVKSEEPAAVFAKMTQTMSQIEQLEFSGEFNILGSSTVALLQGLQDLRVSGSGRVNLTNANNIKYLLNLLITGMSSEGKTEIGAELRSFPDVNYFRLTQITMPLGLPFSLAPDNKWYQIKSGGQNRELLGSNQPLTPDQLQLIRGLIANTKLFNVVQKFPDETVGGTRVYHWQVAVDKAATRGLLQNWSNLTNPEDSINLEQWAAMLSDYTYEFWIGKYDHRLMRVLIKGWYDSLDQQRVEFNTQINFDRFSSIPAIERPTNVQEFNLRQLLGLPNATQ